MLLYTVVNTNTFSNAVAIENAYLKNGNSQWSDSSDLKASYFEDFVIFNLSFNKNVQLQLKSKYSQKTDKFIIWNDSNLIKTKNNN